MSLPEGVSVKFGIYTLACRELLSHLLALKLATIGDDRLSEKDCIKRFDEAMHNFFLRSAVTDIVKASERFADRLSAESRDIRDINNSVADILDEIVDAVTQKAPTWDFVADLERFHSQGRALAQRYFANSTNQVTEMRLQIKCRLEIEYDTVNTALNANCSEAFGFRVAPVAYNVNTEGQPEHVIRVRFNFQHDFSLYISYTFLFLHEYTAHIYSTDYGNERFNDGWMLHTASSFLFNEWHQAKHSADQIRDQAVVFHEYLYRVINPIPRRACRFAGEFERDVCEKLPGRFLQITHELAAFQPERRENIFWPNQFVNLLEGEFLSNRDRLFYKVRESTSIRDLMAKLPFRG